MAEDPQAAGGPVGLRRRQGGVVRVGPLITPAYRRRRRHQARQGDGRSPVGYPDCTPADRTRGGAPSGHRRTPPTCPPPGGARPVDYLTRDGSQAARQPVPLAAVLVRAPRRAGWSATWRRATTPTCPSPTTASSSARWPRTTCARAPPATATRRRLPRDHLRVVYSQPEGTVLPPSFAQYEPQPHTVLPSSRSRPSSRSTRWSRRCTRTNFDQLQEQIDIAVDQLYELEENLLFNHPALRPAAQRPAGRTASSRRGRRRPTCSTTCSAASGSSPTCSPCTPRRWPPSAARRTPWASSWRSWSAAAAASTPGAALADLPHQQAASARQVALRRGDRAARVRGAGPGAGRQHLARRADADGRGEAGGRRAGGGQQQGQRALPADRRRSSWASATTRSPVTCSARTWRGGGADAGRAVRRPGHGLSGT